MPNLLTIGADAPNIIGKDQNGNEVSLADFKDSKVVLYFYPKDDTSVCTKQACNLRDNHSELLAKGIKVLGISPDNETSHQKFIKKFELPFPLIADTEQKWANAYGTWGEKSMYGRKYMGMFRITYLIDEEGKIAHIIEKVKADTHTEQILKLWGIS